MAKKSGKAKKTGRTKKSSRAKKNSKTLPIIAGIALLAGAAYMFSVYFDDKNKESPIVKTTLPEFDNSYAVGQSLFQSNCAGCHGVSLGGIKGTGPPFVHQYYTPGHHADIAFYRAIETGVVAHHWQFGNMPPIPSLTRTEASAIIRYIRAVQSANGIS